jgi:hypothetical protein
MSKVFKKPSLLARQFGVDNDGNNGAKIFAKEWANEVKRNSDVGGVIFTTIASGIVGAAIYGFSQWAEHGLMNVRPELPEAAYMQLDEAPETISAVTIYNDHDSNVTSWGNVSGENTYLLIETNGSYEISSCSGNRCSPLSADEVRELRGEMRLMATEEDISYLNPAFFFPRKIESLTNLMQIQDIAGTFNDESFIAREAKRSMISTSYEVNDNFQRLNSELVDFNVDEITTLWSAALESPDNGTYEIRDGEDDLFTWQRTQTGEWRDLPTSEYMPFTMLGVFLLTSMGIGLSYTGTARRNTQSKTKKLKGLDLLKP